MDDRTRGLDSGRRADLKMPCPLLVERRCSVYSVRPLKCRGGNSVDSDTCQNYWEQGESGPLPVYLPQITAADRVQAGIAEGLDRPDGDRLELVAALRIALDDPHAGCRWIAGEPVFEEARLAAAEIRRNMRNSGVSCLPPRGRLFSYLFLPG